MKRFAACLAAGLLALFLAYPLPADQTDPRLDDLLAQLKQAGGFDEVMTLETKIWSIWRQTGDQRLDNLFLSARQALAGQSPKSALKIYDEIIAERPDMAEPWNGRASANNRLGNCAASVVDSREAIKREARHFGALHGLGECLLRLNRAEEALDAFRRAVAIHPKHMPSRERVEELERWFRNREI